MNRGWTSACFFSWSELIGASLHLHPSARHISSSSIWFSLYTWMILFHVGFWISFFFCLLDDCIAHVWLCSSLLLSFVGCTWFSGDKASKLCSVCQCFSGKHPPGGASFTCSLGTWNAWLCWFRPGVGQLFDCDRYLCLYLSDSSNTEKCMRFS